jgi:phosphoribosylformylglycinamidine synthase I
MKSAVIVFPGINRERDMARALKLMSGREPAMVWHADRELPAGTDLVVIPGGFSYGDYLRCGAIAARAPIMDAVRTFAAKGGLVLAVCNGFQIACEAGLLPGVLMRNAQLRFICRDVYLRVERSDTAFTRGYNAGQVIRVPVAHGEGNYIADGETIARLEGEGRVLFRYASPDGMIDPNWNHNGALNAIAGIVNERGNVLGMMPHPENHVEAVMGCTDGRGLFAGLVILLIQVVFIVHAAKTGRFWPWGYVILFLPGFGALAYVLVELVPEWFGSVQGQHARKRVVSTLDPGKRYRLLTDQLEVTDTIANRSALAEECLALGKFDEALRHYEHILSLPLGDDAVYALGKARAQFGLGHAQETVATLDDLRARWPDYQSAEAHLLYARALEDSGRTDDALAEYQVVAGYYAGAEARVRYGLLLDKTGRQAEAKTVLTEVLAQLKRAPKYVRRAQAEWIALAEKTLRS